MIQKNNQRENKSRVNHQYKVEDKVLYKRDDKAKYQNDPWDGPYKIEEVFKNRTVRFKKGSLSDVTNIRLIIKGAQHRLTVLHIHYYSQDSSNILLLAFAHRVYTVLCFVWARSVSL